MTDTQPTIPGLEGARPNDTPMVSAARFTLAALDEAGRIEPRHALLVQLILSLSGAIDGGTRQGRASAVAMASKELREALLQLDPPPEEGDQGEAARRALADFVAKVEAAANAG